MGQSLYLPALVIIVGFAAALFFARPQQNRVWERDAGAARGAGAHPAPAERQREATAADT
jgi:hypothetical protein